VLIFAVARARAQLSVDFDAAAVGHHVVADNHIISARVDRLRRLRRDRLHCRRQSVEARRNAMTSRRRRTVKKVTAQHLYELAYCYCVGAVCHGQSRRTA